MFVRVRMHMCVWVGVGVGEGVGVSIYLCACESVCVRARSVSNTVLMCACVRMWMRVWKCGSIWADAQDKCATNMLYAISILRSAHYGIGLMLLP